jgi:hypothetical protein
MKCVRIKWIEIFHIEKKWFKKFNIAFLSLVSPFFIQNFMFLHGLFIKYILTMCTFGITCIFDRQHKDMYFEGHECNGGKGG